MLPSRSQQPSTSKLLHRSLFTFFCQKAGKFYQPQRPDPIRTILEKDDRQLTVCSKDSEHGTVKVQLERALWWLAAEYNVTEYDMYKSIINES